jgi:hypothetical protein
MSKLIKVKNLKKINEIVSTSKYIKCCNDYGYNSYFGIFDYNYHMDNNPFNNKMKASWEIKRGLSKEHHVFDLTFFLNNYKYDIVNHIFELNYNSYLKYNTPKFISFYSELPIEIDHIFKTTKDIVNLYNMSLKNKKTIILEIKTKNNKNFEHWYKHGKWWLNNGDNEIKDDRMYAFNNLYDYSISRGLLLQQLVPEQSYIKNNRIYMKDNSGFFNFYELNPANFKEAEK